MSLRVELELGQAEKCLSVFLGDFFKNLCVHFPPFFSFPDCVQLTADVARLWSTIPYTKEAFESEDYTVRFLNTFCCFHGDDVRATAPVICSFWIVNMILSPHGKQCQLRASFALIYVNIVKNSARVLQKESS